MINAPLSNSIALLAQQVQTGKRRALSRAVTLVESTHPEDRKAAEALLRQLTFKNNDKSALRPALRLGITGPPGAGKSTFIEALGLELADNGHKVGVLAIDPSSPKAGGSLLGDKTRMETLSRHPNSFIRPAPSQNRSGGLNPRAHETLWLLEAAHYDPILIETVGAGQGEFSIANLADLVLLVLPPAAGDELQGLKKGIVELADFIIINKADGDLKSAAIRACSEYRSALSPDGRGERVHYLSSLTKDGLPELLNHVTALHQKQLANGEVQERRKRQSLNWFREEFYPSLASRLHQLDEGYKLREGIEQRIEEEGLIPSIAVQDYIDLLLNGLKQD